MFHSGRDWGGSDLSQDSIASMRAGRDAIRRGIRIRATEESPAIGPEPARALILLGRYGQVSYANGSGQVRDLSSCDRLYCGDWLRPI